MIVRSAPTIEAIISDAESRNRAIKQTQFAGADSLFIRSVQGTSAYDASLLIPAGEAGNVPVTLTAPIQEFPLTDLTVDVYADGVGPSYLLTPQSAAWGNLIIFNIPRNTATPRFVQWNIVMWNYDGSDHTYYFKIHIQSTG